MGWDGLVTERVKASIEIHASYQHRPSHPSQRSVCVNASLMRVQQRQTMVKAYMTSLMTHVMMSPALITAGEADEAAAANVGWREGRGGTQHPYVDFIT